MYLYYDAGTYDMVYNHHYNRYGTLFNCSDREKHFFKKYVVRGLCLIIVGKRNFGTARAQVGLILI